MRGVGGNIIILEECAYIPPNTFFEVILPILSLAVTALIAITTISGDENNYINNFIRQGLIAHEEITLVCKACRRAGKSADCTHEQNKRPAWHSEDRATLIKRLYGEGRKDVLAREQLGVLVDKNNRCFKKEKVFLLFEKFRTSLQFGAKYIFVVIDPAGGSQKPEDSNSDFAVCTVVIERGNIVIKGLEAFVIQNPEDYQGRLVRHIRKCYEDPCLLTAQLVVITEGNLALEAGYVRQLTQQQFPQCICLSNQGRKDGVKTDEYTKGSMAMKLDHVLNSESISICKDLVTTHDNPAQLLDQAKEQLLRYSRLAIPIKNPFDKSRFKFSGKGMNVTDKDDIAIVIQLAVLWTGLFFTSDFARYHR